MGYLNNSTITVDAILTKKGREILAQGTNAFQITQFALADDEIDYDLYNPDHSLGIAFYGAAIENLPMKTHSRATTDPLQSHYGPLQTTTAHYSTPHHTVAGWASWLGQLAEPAG